MFRAQLRWQFSSSMTGRKSSYIAHRLLRMTFLALVKLSARQTLSGCLLPKESSKLLFFPLAGELAFGSSKNDACSFEILVLCVTMRRKCTHFLQSFYAFRTIFDTYFIRFHDNLKIGRQDENGWPIIDGSEMTWTDARLLQYGNNSVGDYYIEFVDVRGAYDCKAV